MPVIIQLIPQGSLVSTIVTQRTSNSGECTWSRVVNWIEFLIYKQTPPCALLIRFLQTILYWDIARLFISIKSVSHVSGSRQNN